MVYEELRFKRTLSFGEAVFAGSRALAAPSTTPSARHEKDLSSLHDALFFSPSPKEAVGIKSAQSRAVMTKMAATRHNSDPAGFWIPNG